MNNDLCGWQTMKLQASPGNTNSSQIQLLQCVRVTDLDGPTDVSDHCKAAAVIRTGASVIRRHMAANQIKYLKCGKQH